MVFRKFHVHKVYGHCRTLKNLNSEKCLCGRTVGSLGGGMHLRVGAASFVMRIEVIDLETQEAVGQTLR